MRHTLKIIFNVLIILCTTNNCFADSFTDMIQDLTVQIACKGQYSASESCGGWYNDPYDYYKPQMMADRFSKMSGNKTRTITFYGVCFDYAEFAYSEIKQTEYYYIQNGMFKSQFFLAGVHNDNSQIELTSPTNRENSTQIQNGFYVRNYGASSYQKVKAHKNVNGARAINHSWLWIMRDDGIWFWIDPTWTDNLGYVVYGYISNGEEIQLRPNEDICINYPDYLKTLPLPPKRQVSQIVNNSSQNYSSKTTKSNDFQFNSVPSFSIGYVTSMDSFFDPDKIGFEFAFEDQDALLFGIIFEETVLNFKDGIYSFLVGSNLGLSFHRLFEPYLGGGIGLNFGNSNIFAWKVGCGIRTTLSHFSLRFDVSYGNPFYVSTMIALGFF